MSQRWALGAIFILFIAVNAYMLLNVPAAREAEPLVIAAREPQSVGPPPTLPANVTTEPIFSPDQFMRRYPGPWQFTQNGDQLDLVAGGTILGIDEKQRRDLVSSLAPLFKATVEQLSNKVIETKSGEAIVVRFEQQMHGVAVYGGGISLYLRASDGAVYGIKNELKNPMTVIAEESITPEQAIDAVKAANQEAVRTEPPTKIYQFDTNAQALLCYRVEYKKGAEVRVAHVSMDRGQIVADLPIK